MKEYKILDVISGEYITFYAGNIYFEGLSTMEQAKYWKNKLAGKCNKNRFEIIELIET